MKCLYQTRKVKLLLLLFLKLHRFASRVDKFSMYHSLSNTLNLLLQYNTYDGEILKAYYYNITHTIVSVRRKWWWNIPPISTKRATTSHLSPQTIEHNKYHTLWNWKSNFGHDTHVVALIQLIWPHPTPTPSDKWISHDHTHIKKQSNKTCTDSLFWFERK